MYALIEEPHVLRKSMQFLARMHGLDAQTATNRRRKSCSSVELRDSESQEAEQKLQLVLNAQHNPEKFVRKGYFWMMSKRNQRLQKLIMHSNGVVLEPGGREQRPVHHENNGRFNYKKSLEEGMMVLNPGDEALLSMQPNNYALYLNNIAHSVSRFLQPESQTAPPSNEQPQLGFPLERQVKPDVQKALCSSLAAKREQNFTLVERAVVRATHKAMMQGDQLLQGRQEFTSTLPGGSFGQQQKSKAKRVGPDDRILALEVALKEAQENIWKNARGGKAGQKISKARVEEQDQHVLGRNKFIGKSVDPAQDLIVYFERFCSNLNIRVIKGTNRVASYITEKQSQEANVRFTHSNDGEPNGSQLQTPYSHNVPSADASRAKQLPVQGEAVSHYERMRSIKGSLEECGSHSPDFQFNTVTQSQRRKLPAIESTRTRLENQGSEHSPFAEPVKMHGSIRSSSKHRASPFKQSGAKVKALLHHEKRNGPLDASETGDEFPKQEHLDGLQIRLQRS